MTTKQTVDLEFLINATPNIVYQRLSTAHGLSEWFADDVNTDGNVFTFVWDDDTKRAEMIEHQRNKMVCFRWLDVEDNSHDDRYLTFKLDRDEVTNSLSLRVMEDLSHDDEEQNYAMQLWEQQIGTLKHVLGAL